MRWPAYVECSPTPDVASDSMLPLVEAVTSAQAGTASGRRPLVVAMAIWGQVHGLVGLELAQMYEPETDWAGIYEAALESVARAGPPSPKPVTYA